MYFGKNMQEGIVHWMDQYTYSNKTATLDAKYPPTCTKKQMFEGP